MLAYFWVVEPDRVVFLGDGEPEALPAWPADGLPQFVRFLDGRPELVGAGFDELVAAVVLGVRCFGRRGSGRVRRLAVVRLGDVFNARLCYRHAARAIEEAGDRGLGSYIQGYQGMVTVQTEGPARALVQFHEASDTAPRSLSGPTRSWLMILKAEALARTGQLEAAVAAVGCAEELLAGGPPSGQDPWMYEFDHGSLAAHVGNCYLALNQPKQATKSYEEALRLATAALTTFATSGSAAGVPGVCGLRSDFARAGLGAAASALDEHARALLHVGG